MVLQSIIQYNVELQRIFSLLCRSPVGWCGWNGLHYYVHYLPLETSSHILTLVHDFELGYRSPQCKGSLRRCRRDAIGDIKNDQHHDYGDIAYPNSNGGGCSCPQTSNNLTIHHLCSNNIITFPQNAIGDCYIRVFQQILFLTTQPSSIYTLFIFNFNYSNVWLLPWNVT